MLCKKQSQTKKAKGYTIAVSQFPCAKIPGITCHSPLLKMSSDWSQRVHWYGYLHWGSESSAKFSPLTVGGCQFLVVARLMWPTSYLVRITLGTEKPIVISWYVTFSPYVSFHSSERHLPIYPTQFFFLKFQAPTVNQHNYSQSSRSNPNLLLTEHHSQQSQSHSTQCTMIREFSCTWP